MRVDAWTEIANTAASLGAGTWQMLLKAGIYVIVGLLAAGLVHVFVSQRLLVRHLGGRGFWPVLKAALVGAPLPLCSCSVLPTALAVRRKGAGRGATVSFLISTPETSFDSIAVTWALMGPAMAVVRPVAAVATAILAGLAESFRSRRIPEPVLEDEAAACPQGAAGEDEKAFRVRRWGRFWRFVAVELGDEIGPTLALGLLLAALVAVFVPADFFERSVGSPIVSMLLALVVGLPLYVCATASTPLAAALLLKGMNPGAVLVFLLVGPATNLATVLTVGRLFGKASAGLYVGMIAAISLACGFILDAAVGTWDVAVGVEHMHRVLPGWVEMAGAVVLAAWLAVALVRYLRKKLAHPKAAAASCCEGGTAEAQTTSCCEEEAPEAAAPSCCGSSEGEGATRAPGDHR